MEMHVNSHHSIFLAEVLFKKNIAKGFKIKFTDI